METIVSVVIPAYNVEQYLPECVESVIKQTFRDWELFIVNDGSQDNTLRCAQRYADMDERITVIDQKNGGVSTARNAGLNAARGKYIIFLDGDDFWEATILEKLVNAICQSGMKIAYCGYNRLYSNGLIRKYRYKYPSGDILIPPENEPVQLHIGAMLFEKDFLVKNQLSFTVGGLIGQDLEFIQKALALTSVQSVPENLMIYRQRGGSALHSGWKWQKQLHALKGRQRAIDFITQKASEISGFEEKIQFLNKQLSYKALRFLWRMIKNGAGNEAAALTRDAEFAGFLKYLDIQSLGLIDRFKYRIVMSGNPKLWFIPKILG